MTVRTIYFATNSVLYVAIIAVSVRPTMLAPFGLLPFLFPIFAALSFALLLAQWLIGCPHCGQSLAFRKVDWSGHRVTIYNPWPPKDCSECGTSL
jgi:hypothetical protein